MSFGIVSGSILGSLWHRIQCFRVIVFLMFFKDAKPIVMPAQITTPKTYIGELMIRRKVVGHTNSMMRNSSLTPGLFGEVRYAWFCEPTLGNHWIYLETLMSQAGPRHHPIWWITSGAWVRQHTITWRL